MVGENGPELTDTAVSCTEAGDACQAAAGLCWDHPLQGNVPNSHCLSFEASGWLMRKKHFYQQAREAGGGMEVCTQAKLTTDPVCRVFVLSSQEDGSVLM